MEVIMAGAPGNNVSAIVPEIWSKRYYEILLAELVFEASMSRDYEGEIRNLGDTVHIPTIPEFGDAEELGEADAANTDSVDVSTQDLVVNRRVVKDFIVTNQAMLQSIPFVEKLKEMAGYAIKKKIEAMIIAATVPSVSPDHTISYGGAVASLADLLNSKKLLDDQNVPQAGRVLIMGSKVMNDLFTITGFTSSDFVAGVNPLTSGELPARLLGFQPKFTTLVGNTSYFFHGSYLTVAAQQGMATKEYDLGVQGVRATRVNLDTLIGLKQLDEKRVVAIS